MPDTTPSVPADVVQAAELIHRDIAEAMDVIYGEIGGMDDTPEDVDATSKRIADDIRIVLNWVLAQAQPAPVSPVGADTPDGQPFWPAQVYVLLRDVPIDRTECVNACISIDRDANGGLVGVEVMGAISVDVNGAAVSASGEVPQ